MQTDTNDKAVRPDVKTDVERSKESALRAVIVSDETIELTHEAAYAHLNLPTFVGEREVSDAHVQELYDEMAKGRFRPEHVCLAACYVGSAGDAPLYRVNGQHTCWARTYMPKAYACAVRYITYRVPNLAELKKLYAVFDPAYSARSKGHLTKVLLVDTPTAEGVWAGALAHLSGGFRFWFWDNRNEQRRAGHNEVAEAIGANAELFRTVAEFLQAHWKAQHVSRRQGVVAACFECWDRRPTLAEDFWKPVADGLGLTEKTDPRYALREWLLTHAIDAGSGRRSEKKKTDAEEVYRIAIAAWNRWRAGEKVAILRPTARRVRAQ